MVKSNRSVRWFDLEVALCTFCIFRFPAQKKKPTKSEINVQLLSRRKKKKERIRKGYVQRRRLYFHVKLYFYIIKVKKGKTNIFSRLLFRLEKKLFKLPRSSLLTRNFLRLLVNYEIIFRILYVLSIRRAISSLLYFIPQPLSEGMPG